jgi:hypothetical protein
MTPQLRIVSRRIGLPILFALGIFASWTCTHDEGALLKNVPPIARLSNVPPPEDTINTTNPRLALSWVGDDADGYVVGFRYRWSVNSLRDPNLYRTYKIILNIIIQKFALMANTENVALIPGVYKYFATLPPEGLDIATVRILARGDSIDVAGVKVYASNSDSVRLPSTGIRVANNYPIHVNPNGGTFIFDSADSVNLHTFEIEAIDNLGALSTIPSRVSFTTPKVEPPQTFAQGGTPDTSFVLMKKTDTFLGIPCSYQGIDPNSRTIDYQWVVDLDQWPADSIPWSDFTPSQTVFVAGENFPNPYASEHTFYVRARNEFNSVDPTPATITFHTIYPDFMRPGYQQRILMINTAFDSANATAWHPTRTLINDYYTSMLNVLGKNGKVDIWNAGDDPPPAVNVGFPYRLDFTKYSLVIVTADHANFNGQWKPNLNVGRTNKLMEYCNVGGRLLITGWAPRAPGNIADANANFYRSVIHVDPDVRSPVLQPDFMGARGVLGYPDIVWDTTKMNPDWFGGLPGHWITQPVGFGEIIYKFDARNDLSPLENRPIGVRYIGVTFNCVFLGFPLYFVEPQIAQEVLRIAMSDIGELNRP